MQLIYLNLGSKDRSNDSEQMWSCVNVKILEKFLRTSFSNSDKTINNMMMNFRIRI